jgi:metallo-beta-lactamase family protein
MRLTFVSGATHVTGANYLLEAGGLRLLVDCGMIQGARFSDEWNYPEFPYDAMTVDALFVTHSHVDHMGRIPKLVREGFDAPVYAVEPTAAIIAVALPDTFTRVSEEAANLGLPPLYEQADLDRALSLFRPVKYHAPMRLNDRVTVEAYDSGHVLGSTNWVFTIMDDDGSTKRIAFPGDIGNPPSILLRDIDYVRGVDYTLVESAYGSRVHEARDQRQQMLEGVIKETYDRKGVLMIPSFAVERTQELLLELDRLFELGHLPKMPVFVDSPLAIGITKVYGRFSSYFNEGAREILRDNRGIFQFPWLTMTPTVAESKKINDVPAPKVIIAGSGMSQGGRIQHHEARYLRDSRSTILFVGYQVQGSLGRRIRDKEREVTIFGNRIPVHCHVHSIGAFSAHADQNGLIEYINKANTAEGSKKGTLKKCFVVQGEREAADALAARAVKDLGVDAVVPELGQVFDL